MLCVFNGEGIILLGKKKKRNLKTLTGLHFFPEIFLSMLLFRIDYKLPIDQ